MAYSTERVSDVARVLARMGDAIAIRCYGDPVDWVYGGANDLSRNFAYWADNPVLNMEDDKYHPFQALADVLTVKEKFGSFKGVKFVMSWAYSPSVHKPRAVPRSAIIAATMMGCDTVLAHPPEMTLDPGVIAACQGYAAMNGSSFEVSHDFEEAARGAHVLYPKAWAATPIFQPPVGQDDPKKTQEIFELQALEGDSRVHGALPPKRRPKHLFPNLLAPSPSGRTIHAPRSCKTLLMKFLPLTTSSSWLN